MALQLAIVPHATPDMRRYAILREVADALPGTGFATDLATIVASCGVSRREVVREFGGMDRLLLALAAMLTTSLLESLSACATEAMLLERLRGFAARMGGGKSGLQLRRLHRLALAATAGDGVQGEAFYRQGPGLVLDELARFFRSAQYAGFLPAGDSRRLAGHFLALVRGGWHGGDVGDDARAGIEAARIVDAFWSGITRATDDDVPAAH
jgi:AcrR family transcriptional regulator